jgi:1,4-dihydroxy-2-naphthoate octaprenyltransferase
MPENSIIALRLGWDRISLEIVVAPVLAVLFLSVSPVCTTANIMLANNICDVEKDIAVKRYTLPYYLGKKSLQLFALLYYLCYAAVVAMVLLKILSPLCLLILLTLWPVQKNINIFFRRQEKAVTFITSIKNYVLIMGSSSLLIFVSALIRF